jgi:serine phosphatase RsbU (regulator of sigma subunit)
MTDGPGAGSGAERELADRLVLALGAGDLGTWQWDMATGVTTWDEQLERLFGIEPGSFPGTFDAWVELLHPDDAPAVVAVLERAVVEKASYDVEHRVVWPDGTVHWLQGRGMVTVDANGNVTGTIGCTGDVTARKLLLLETSERAAVAEALAEQERRQRERLEFLGAINDASRVAGDHRELMREVAAAAVPRLGDWCAIHFLAEQASAPEIEVAHTDPAKVAWARALIEQFPFDPDAEFGVALAIRSGRTELYRDIDRTTIDEILGVTKLPPDEVRAAIDRLQPTSTIIVPLRTKQGVVGAMQFVRAESGRRYDDADVALAEAAAGRVAEALDNAWLTEQHRAIAATLQQALLPPRLPDIAGISVAARYWAAGVANQVGGDFYDIFRVHDDEWAVVIGDVCGTGPDAAAVTAIARHTIRAAATHDVAPAELLEWLNDALYAGNRDLFCTTLYATVARNDDGTWRYRSITGGHPLPILVRADGSAAPIGRPGRLIGALPTVGATPFEATLAPGDTVVLYTDGVTDLHPPYHLDDAAFCAMAGETVTAATAATAEGMIEQLRATIDRWLPLADRHDDIAIVVLHIEPPEKSPPPA